MTAYKLTSGDKVQGMYYGHKFSGTVQFARFHSCRNDLIEVSVKLDSPISVYGDPRETIIVSCNSSDGSSVQGWGDQYLIAA